MIKDLVIIGGGLAGSASAIWAAREGYEVLLIEKETRPHDKVCGEFLSIEAQHDLQELGIDLQTLGAQAITHLDLGNNKYHHHALLPFTGQSLSRRILDESLLNLAEESGTTIQRGGIVVGLDRQNDFWSIAMHTGEMLQAKNVFLATGKHDLKGWGRKKTKDHDLIGFKMHFQCHDQNSSQQKNSVILALLKQGYAGLEPIEKNKINLCLVIRKKKFIALGKDWNTLLTWACSQNMSLRQHLENTSPCWKRPLAMYGIPYGYVCPQQHGVLFPNLYHLGDQAAVIPSFCGDGMAMALGSARLAVQHLATGTHASYQARVNYYFRRQVNYAMILAWFVQRPWRQSVILLILKIWPSLLHNFIKDTRSRLSNQRL